MIFGPDSIGNRELCQGYQGLLADHRAGFQKAAREHAALAQDECEAQVVHAKAWVFSEAESVVSQKVAQPGEAASSVDALRSHLDHAQQVASTEAEQTQAALTSEVRTTLIEQEAEVSLQQQNAQASEMIRDLHVRLATAEGSSLRMQNEKPSRSGISRASERPVKVKYKRQSASTRVLATGNPKQHP